MTNEYDFMWRSKSYLPMPRPHLIESAQVTSLSARPYPGPDPVPDLCHGLICNGCGLPAFHKMCPAHGTPYYMSGVKFPGRLESEWVDE